MDLGMRLLVLVVLVGIGAALTLWYRRRVDRDAGLGATDEATGTARWPVLPGALLRGDLQQAGPSALMVAPPDHPTDAVAPATWVIFSTPLCVSCSAVQADLERHFPHHRVIKIDATEQPDLAAQYEVRRAPTTIVADREGRIVERLVGPEGVRDFIGDAEDITASSLRPTD
jgi:hypothetical protein